jgi:hypothetical protein
MSGWHSVQTTPKFKSDGLLFAIGKYHVQSQLGYLLVILTEDIRAFPQIFQTNTGIAPPSESHQLHSSSPQ